VQITDINQSSRGGGYRNQTLKHKYENWNTKKMKKILSFQKKIEDKGQKKN